MIHIRQGRILAQALGQVEIIWGKVFSQVLITLFLRIREQKGQQEPKFGLVSFQ